MRYAVVNELTKTVKNVIEWDEKTNWKPPEGHYLVQTNDYDIGDLHDKATKTFVRVPKSSRPVKK
jgi:hypothetical protein